MNLISRLFKRLSGKQPEPLYDYEVVCDHYVFEGVKVGDRFKSKLAYTYAMEGVLTVTELTPQGFKYTVEKPYHLFPARYGPSMMKDGELLINSPHHPKSLWNASYERVT